MGWLLALAALPLFAAETAVPRPPGLERDVQFWVRVYTEVTTNGGFLHDDRNLAVDPCRVERLCENDVAERHAAHRGGARRR